MFIWILLLSFNTCIFGEVLNTTCVCQTDLVIGLAVNCSQCTTECSKLPNYHSAYCQTLHLNHSSYEWYDVCGYKNNMRPCCSSLKCDCFFDTITLNLINDTYSLDTRWVKQGSNQYDPDYPLNTVLSTINGVYSFVNPEINMTYAVVFNGVSLTVIPLPNQTCKQTAVIFDDSMVSFFF